MSTFPSYFASYFLVSFDSYTRFGLFTTIPFKSLVHVSLLFNTYTYTYIPF